MKQRLKRPLLRLLWSTGAAASPWLDRPADLGRVRRILVFQGGGIGDVIRVFPALRALHQALPGTSITSLTQYGANLFRLFPRPEAVTDHVVYDLQGAHRGLLPKIRLALALRRRRFDMIFSPNYGLGMIEAAIFSFLVGAPCRIGFDHGGAGFLYTIKRNLAPTPSIQEQALALLAAAGLPLPCPERYLQVPEDGLVHAQAILRHAGIPEGCRLVVVAPEVKTDARYGSFPEYRAWPLAHMAVLLREIPRRLHARVVLLGRPLADSGALGLEAGAAAAPVVNLLGETTLAEAAGLIGSAQLFIGNDSGLLHVAVGLQVPSVAIFGATAPHQVIPQSDMCVSLWKGLPCSPCFSHQPLFDLVCPFGVACLTTITPAEVLEAAERLLARPQAAAQRPPP